MVGIYKSDFIDYLKKHLAPVKTTPKNIICRCPWCEYNKKTDHFHLHISLDAPIFNCFHAGCKGKGYIGKLIKKIEGVDQDISQYVDESLIKQSEKKFNKRVREINISYPKIEPEKFPDKVKYLMGRLKYANVDLSELDGLVLDIDAFIETNKMSVEPGFEKMRKSIQDNFIGFGTKHGSKIVLRNITNNGFQHTKLPIYQSLFLDYYQLNGDNPNSNIVVMAEGIYDIYTEWLFDNVGLKKNVKMYVTSLSDAYNQLLKSIVIDEQIFRPDIIILSDNGLDLNFYKKFKKFNNHMINSLIIYYNKNGKDFNDTPVVPIKHIL